MAIQQLPVVEVAYPLGLVKYPPRMFDAAYRWALRGAIGMLVEEVITPSLFPKTHAFVLSVAKQYNVKPKDYQHYGVPFPRCTATLPIDFSGLPGYPEYTGEMTHYKVVNDMTGFYSKQVGVPFARAWLADNKNPIELGTNYGLLAKLLMKNLGPVGFSDHKLLRETRTMFREVGHLIQHELAHLTQTLLLAPVDQRQVDRTGIPARQSKGMDKYFSENVEFGPQVLTAIEEARSLLMEWVGMQACYTPPKQLVRVWTAQQPTSSVLNGVENFMFFESIKRTDPERYREALRLFVKGLLQLSEWRDYVTMHNKIKAVNR